MSKGKYSYQVDSQKIMDIITKKGVTPGEASLRIGAHPTYLTSHVIPSGSMSKPYIRAFCLEFGVSRDEIVVSTKRMSSPNEMINIDMQKCRELIFKNGYTMSSLSKQLGYDGSYLHACDQTSRINKNAFDKLCKILGVSPQSLLLQEPEEEQKEEEPSGTIIDRSDALTLIMCFYNLATSIEAAMTGFRQDLIAFNPVLKGVLNNLNDDKETD